MPDVTSSTFLNQFQVPQANPASLVAGSTSAASTPVDKTHQLGKQDFLKLLMAQLKNQDPLKPMDDSQMIAQMAQFSALESTQNLTSVIQQSSNMQTVIQAGALIGKYIEAQQADGSTINGAVTGVTFETTNGMEAPTLLVDGTDVDYGTIRQISSTPIS